MSQRRSPTRRTNDRMLLVVRPERGNAFYNELAERLFSALCEFHQSVRLVPAGDVPNDVATTSLILVNPMECALSGGDFVAAAARARTRVAALAECAETKWYRDQFRIDGLTLDAIHDVGFESQEDRHTGGAPYHFVFNGMSAGDPLPESHARRPIPW